MTLFASWLLSSPALAPIAPSILSVIPEDIAGRRQWYLLPVLDLRESRISLRPMPSMETQGWELYPSSFIGAEIIEYTPISEDGDDQDGDLPVSLDAILPDDLLEKVLSFLPVVSVIRAGSVSKRWHEVANALRCTMDRMVPQRPWYFMFTCSDPDAAVSGFAYDPALRKWYSFEFPCIEKNNWSASSSAGLVCLMDSQNRSRIFVCNPVTKDWKRLADAPGGRSADHSAVTISATRKAHCYTVVVVRCNQVPEDDYQLELSIHLYNSESGCWLTPIREVLNRWRGGEEFIICKGVLYYLVYCTRLLVNNEHRHRLIF